MKEIQDDCIVKIYEALRYPPHYIYVRKNTEITISQK